MTTTINSTIIPLEITINADPCSTSQLQFNLQRFSHVECSAFSYLNLAPAQCKKALFHLPYVLWYLQIRCNFVQCYGLVTQIWMFIFNQMFDFFSSIFPYLVVFCISIILKQILLSTAPGSGLDMTSWYSKVALNQNNDLRDYKLRRTGNMAPVKTVTWWTLAFLGTASYTLYVPTRETCYKNTTLQLAT